MLNKKAEEIRELRRRLEVAENLPYLQLARQIYEDVERATAAGMMDVDAVIATAISNAKEARLQEVLEERLDSLEPATLLGLYAARLGDERVNELLARRGLVEYEQARGDQLILELRQEAERSNRLDLTKLPAGVVVTIGLFDPEEDEEDKVHDEDGDYSVRLIKGRVDHPETPNLLTII